MQNGIGGYDLADNRDQAFAFDYDHSGKLDHIVLYRPGLGTMWILRNQGGQFGAVYAEGSPGHGIGGYDLADNRDQAFAFDYDHSGKLDHIVLYRPGLGTMWILRNQGGQFGAVYAEGSPGHGIGGYDLADNRDRAFAFDYDHSGKLDHIVLYRPGLGTMWILRNQGGQFGAVYAEGSPGHGIGGYDLADNRDRAFAFDYDHSGKLDHIVLYRPGLGTMWILRNQGGQFGAVYAEGSPGHGIGGYDLADNRDRAFAFDYDHSGKLDHIVLYRPGLGTMWILRNQGGQFGAVYAEGSPGHGIGGYDLADNRDRAFAFDYDHSGKLDSLDLYRPGEGATWILTRPDPGFRAVYHTSSVPVPPTNIKATSTQSEITLTWTNAIPDIDDIELDRSPNDESFPKSLPGPATTFTNTGLTPNSSYTFRLRTVNPAGASAWTAITVTTGAPNQQLRMTEQHQEQSNWCWAASTASIAAFYDSNTSWTQCLLANHEFGQQNCCADGAGAACNQAWYPDRALTTVGRLASNVYAPLSFNDVRAQIQASHPISIGIFWNGGGGHNPVISGFDDLNGQTIDLEDPWFGPSTRVDFATFPTNYQGGATWGQTCTTQ